MERKILGLTVAALLALAPIAAQQSEQTKDEKKSERADRGKSNKKHVKATLLDVPPTPAPPTPTATPTADSSAGSATTTTTTKTTGDRSAPTAGSSTQPATEASADAPAGDSFQERVEVVEVQLDVVVKDGGKQVTGLGPEDFVVTEEGRPVEVTSADFYGAPDELEATGEGDVQRADRYFIFLFHDRSREAGVVRTFLLDAGQQARKWVEQDRLPNDQVAVMTYDVRLKIYTDFTRDQEQILDAISQAVASKKEPDRGAGSSEEPLRPSADSPSLLLNLPAGEDLARESRVFEETIALLGRAAEGIVGRKNLMLFSLGFGETDSNGIWTKDVRYYPAMERNLNDGNVAVYAIDLLGGRGGQGGVGMASSLSSIAGDTAGRYFDSFTNFRTPIKEVAKETAGYYLLSYRSEYPRGTSGYREVKVDTRQKSYEVRARKGYLFGAIPDPEEASPTPNEPTGGRG